MLGLAHHIALHEEQTHFLAIEDFLDYKEIETQYIVLPDITKTYQHIPFPTLPRAKSIDIFDFPM